VTPVRVHVDTSVGSLIEKACTRVNLGIDACMVVDAMAELSVALVIAVAFENAMLAEPDEDDMLETVMTTK